MRNPTLFYNGNGFSVIACNSLVYKGQGFVTLLKGVVTGIKNVSSTKSYGKYLRLFLIKLRKNVSSVAEGGVILALFRKVFIGGWYGN